MKPLALILTSILPILSVFASTPGITHPAKGSIIAPDAFFEFKYRSMADYGTSSYNFTVWLFTSPPRFFQPSKTFATGFHLGRFSQANYPANMHPQNPPPSLLKMPDVSKLGGGWGVGANITHATFYLAVIEEYGNGAPSMGYRMSLAVNEIIYNGTRP
ncbi:hypothetical protein C8J57DRAFT_1279478 [Mycena rebaudengoi]|nr:hypothetical protein C8J57DRAFT_1279478 [Mycena rebaudengoi]